MNIGNIFKNLFGPSLKAIKEAFRPIITMLAETLLPILIELIPTEEISAFAETITTIIMQLFDAITPLLGAFSSMIPLLVFFSDIIQNIVASLSNQRTPDTAELERKSRYLDRSENERARDRRAYLIFQKQKELESAGNETMQDFTMQNQAALNEAFAYRRHM